MTKEEEMHILVLVVWVQMVAQGVGEWEGLEAASAGEESSWVGGGRVGWEGEQLIKSPACDQCTSLKLTTVLR